MIRRFDKALPIGCAGVLGYYAISAVMIAAIMGIGACAR